MGGMQVLQWAASYPERVFSAVPIACAARHSAQNIAFHEVGRQAIMADPDWKGGDYRRHGTAPERGLAVARMTAHITYLSEQALQRKFGRNAAGPQRAGLRLRRRLPGRELPAPPGLDLRRPLRRQQLPLHHPRHGLLRPRRPAWRRAGQRLQGHARRASARSPSPRDWLFPTRENRAIVHALNAAAANVSLRRGRDRQGPRRLPARRARDVPHAGRLPAGRRRRRAGLESEHAAPIRVDLQLIADMVEPGARALDVGCGDGALLAYLRELQAGRCARHGAQPGRRECLRRQRPVGDPGRRRHRPARLSRRRLRLRDPEPDAAGDARAARGAAADAAGRQAGDRVVPQLRALAGAAAPGVRRPHAARRRRCPSSGTTRPTSISAASTTSARCAATWACGSSAPSC